MPSGELTVDGAAFSEVVLACWVIGSTGTTAYLFYQRDV